MRRFHCSYSGCTSSYRRKEHLRRHEVQHTGVHLYACPSCERSFSRSDTLNRHLRQDHDEAQRRDSRAVQACRQCRIAKVRCRGGSPCKYCQDKGHNCTFDNLAHPRAISRRDVESDTRAAVEHPVFNDIGGVNHVEEYVELYFTHFHPRWPFLHQKTFSAHHEPPLLVYSVVMIGMWIAGKGSLQRRAVDLHNKLGHCIREQQANWEDPSKRQERPSSAWPIATYQGILLYIIFSLIVTPQHHRALDLTLRLSASDHSILTALVRTCLKHNIFYYPAMLGRYQEIDSMACIWVGVEETKRFCLALYKVCRICNNVYDDESGENSGQRLLQLSDLQFPMPDGNQLWEAGSNLELSNLLAKRGIDAQSEKSHEVKWISECGQWLDSNAPGFEWI